jgi:hypothetical protein
MLRERVALIQDNVSEWSGISPTDCFLREKVALIQDNV